MEPEAGEMGLFPRNPEEGRLPPKVGRPIPESRPDAGLPELGLPELGLPELGPPKFGRPEPIGEAPKEEETVGLPELGRPEPLGEAPKEEETGGLETDPPNGSFDPGGFAPSPPCGLPLPR